MNIDRPVLPATVELLEEINGRGDHFLINALTNAVLSFGSRNDADICLDQFQKAPEKEYSASLLKIIGRWGDLSHADKIFSLSTQNDRLHENFPEEVLQILGQLNFEPAKPILAQYVFNSTDYYLNKAAVLGLLHFDCKEYREEIRSGINGIMGKNTFPEYLPALVSKLEDAEEWLEKLFDWGSTTCSTDCNEGILVGFSLCGATGKEYFLRAIFSPAWEAHSHAAPVVLQGMEELSLTFKELFNEMGEVTDQNELKYPFLVTLSVLEEKAFSLKYTGESFKEIYLELIASGLLADLAETTGELSDAVRVEELLMLRMNQELFVKF